MLTSVGDVYSYLANICACVIMHSSWFLAKISDPLLENSSISKLLDLVLL